jgi:hypothetical protein
MARATIMDVPMELISYITSHLDVSSLKQFRLAHPHLAAMSEPQFSKYLQRLCPRLKSDLRAIGSIAGSPNFSNVVHFVFHYETELRLDEDCGRLLGAALNKFPQLRLLCVDAPGFVKSSVGDFRDLHDWFHRVASTLRANMLKTCNLMCLKIGAEDVASLLTANKRLEKLRARDCQLISGHMIDILEAACDLEPLNSVEIELRGIHPPWATDKDPGCIWQLDPGDETDYSSFWPGPDNRRIGSGGVWFAFKGARKSTIQTDKRFCRLYATRSDDTPFSLRASCRHVINSHAKLVQSHQEKVLKE